MFSSYPLVRADLVARFRTALTDPTDPPVFYGHPGRHVPHSYVVVGGPVGTVDREPRTRPLRSSLNMGESYSLPVEVRAFAPARNDPAAQQELVETVDAVVSRLDAAVLADPTLGGLCTHAWVGPWSVPAEDPLSEGRESVLVLEVVVRQARIPA